VRLSFPVQATISVRRLTGNIPEFKGGTRTICTPSKYVLHSFPDSCPTKARLLRLETHLGLKCVTQCQLCFDRVCPGPIGDRKGGWSQKSTHGLLFCPKRQRGNANVNLLVCSCGGTDGPVTVLRNNSSAKAGLGTEPLKKLGSKTGSTKDSRR
jgi:hypothetical protein